MSSEPVDAFKQLDPNTPLGVVAAHLRQEGEQRQQLSMVECADICVRRIHDPDPDLRVLTRALLFLYASTRGIDVNALAAQTRVH